MIDKPPVLSLHLQKIQQQSSHDCGLACVAMVCQTYLHALPDEHVPVFLQRLRHRRSAIARLKGMVHQGHGLWTVDLVNLLLREDLFGALSHRITFYSARTSADPSYKTTFSGFYDAGGQFDGDEERVNLLYKGLIEKQNELDKWATSSGHRQLFIQRKFTKQEMQFLLSQPHCLFIVCCNALLLHCERCNPQDKTNESKKRQDFEGHFVVVVYHDSKNEKVYFLDPASECELCCLGMSQFDLARSSYGTDQDIVKVSLSK